MASRWLPYARLMRLPAVFTAVSDIAAGYALTRFADPVPTDFVALVAASCGLYLSGMVLNDVFDRKLDAAERPERPIPSGDISVQTASWLGGGLMLAGIAAAAVVGITSLLIAVGLALAVLVYDGFLKRTALGPLGMGTCRFLNLMLGSSTAVTVWSLPQLQVAAGLGLYIVGVTWFARQEAQTSNRSQLMAGLGVINLGGALLIALMLNWQPNLHPVSAAIGLLAILLIIDRRAISAVMTPSPAKVQTAVKLQLMSYIMLNATIVYWASENSTSAAVTAALLIPAVFLGRRIRVT